VCVSGAGWDTEASTYAGHCHALNEQLLVFSVFAVLQWHESKHAHVDRERLPRWEAWVFLQHLVYEALGLQK